MESNSKLREELQRLTISHSERVASQKSQFGTELEQLRLEHQKILDQREADEEARSRDAEKERHRLEENVRRHADETASKILKCQEEANQAELVRLEGEEKRWNEIARRRKTLDDSQTAEIRRLQQLNLQLRKQSVLDWKGDIERVSAGARREHKQWEELREQSDIAVALARSKHDEQIRKLRLERQGPRSSGTVGLGVDRRQGEYLGLIELSRSRDLTSAEYASILYDDMVQEERRCRHTGDGCSVEQLTTQFEAQLAQHPQSVRGGDSRYSGRVLEEVGSLESSDLNVDTRGTIHGGKYRSGVDHAPHGSRELESGG